MRFSLSSTRIVHDQKGSCVKYLIEITTKIQVMINSASLRSSMTVFKTMNLFRLTLTMISRKTIYFPISKMPETFIFALVKSFCLKICGRIAGFMHMNVDYNIVVPVFVWFVFVLILKGVLSFS